MKAIKNYISPEKPQKQKGKKTKTSVPSSAPVASGAASSEAYTGIGRISEEQSGPDPINTDAANASSSAGPLSAGRHVSLPPSGVATPHSATGFATPRNQSRPVTMSRMSSVSLSMADVKADITVTHLYQNQLRMMYTGDNEDHTGEGIVLKKARGQYVCQPPSLAGIPGGFYEQIMLMNVACGMTVNTRWVHTLISLIKSRYEVVDSIPVRENMQLQVLSSIKDLPHCQKHHFGAFILEPPMLVVWDDEADNILKRVHEIEENIMNLVWKENDEEEESNDGDNEVDLEAAGPEKREIPLTRAWVVSLALCLAITCMALGWRHLALEIMLDSNYKRLLLLLAFPPQMFISMFFFLAIIGNIFQMVGPVSSVTENSKFFSGKAPPRLNRFTSTLPHVTIQMPVYKEGLNAVIKPTIHSIKAAISSYEMQGGTANIFINDDGMQLISAEQARARQEFYEEHNIGWVARPKHNPKPADGEKGFVRKGKFKKASNMNYALWTSNCVEEKLQGIARHDKWTQKDEDAAYSRALEEVIAESNGDTWAAGDIRMGDYILIIDSDTRVPKDCLLDSVSEMEQSPEVAIIQHTSGVMVVSDSFFEYAVTWFTNMIYTAITTSVSGGDICPFVGHNAFLRWSAIQDAVSYVDEDDGHTKYWSESHVSEDFDMAIRLQSAGYVLRFAAYSEREFQEGVSLTVYDELARWEKYAYGCNELLFHPIHQWWYKGPFAPMFMRFLFSNVYFYQKVGIMAYIGTYYAIGVAWILSLMNYFLTGWFFGHLDKYYIDSFAIYLSIIVVFPALGNVALAVLRYRIGEQGLIYSLWENLKWMPVFTIFLGGISLHVCKAIMCHFFYIDIQWGATSKEVENVNFLEEVPRILKHFFGTFLFCIACTVLIICAYHVFPYMWQIRTFASIYPLCSVIVSHFCLPVLLNPALMKFTF
ncbi:hypothetical protein TD95_001299 [Thielaviopsis punctulata]|uniref:Uncharacterized protein n=1 Tax=Thielaviopsis punctulata TaxID=72032 RepID=A0A0F4ZD10_9PEZI|nr:hypothetical protein TD95_001299 [Thielaviopsis punctulata]